MLWFIGPWDLKATPSFPEKHALLRDSTLTKHETFDQYNVGYVPQKLYHLKLLLNMNLMISILHNIESGIAGLVFGQS
jgi:hypothetical protein